MSKTTSYANDVLHYLFNGVLPAWDANTDLYLSLHTADPGAAGSQTTSEATYTGYARIAIARDSDTTDFLASGGATSNQVELAFAECTAGSNTITHVGLGTASSGAGTLLRRCTLTASLAVSAAVVPTIPVGDLDFSES